MTARIPGHIAPIFSSCGKFGENRKNQDGHLFLILLKSNYSTSHLSPGNSVHAQRLTDSLFVPFFFSMYFQSSRFAPHYTPPISAGKPFPRFLLISYQKPNPLPRQPRQTTSPFPPFFIHSRPCLSTSTNFRNTPDPSNPPASKNSYPLSFQHFQPPPPAVAGKARTMTRKRTLRKCAKDS